MKLFCIQMIITRQFSYVGGMVARYPIYFLIAPIIITAMLSTGALRMKTNRDKDSLFTAINGRAFENKMFVQTHFPINTSTFTDVTRQINFNETNVVMVIAKDGGTVLRGDIFEELRHLDEAIRNITVQWKNVLFDYNALCGKRSGKCVNNGAILLLPHIKDIIAGKYKFMFPFEMNEITFSYTQYVHSFGGVTVDDQGYVKDAKAIRLFYMLDGSDFSKTEAIDRWLKKMNVMLLSTEFNYISVVTINHQAVAKEVTEIADILLSKIPLVVSLMVTFCFITCMTNNWLRSKPWLGPSACLAASLAIISGFGLVLHLGIEYIEPNIGLAFVILGTEIDDSFVLIAAWRSTKFTDSVEKRMKDTYSEAAVSITITSSTNFLAYSIGIATPFPAVKIFCINAAVCIIFSYIYQLAFFGACLAIDGYREERQLHPFTFRHIKGSAVKNSQSLSLKDNEDEFIMAQFRDKIGTLLSHTWIKLMILIIFFANLGIGIWGLRYLKTGNDINDIFTYDSSVTKATLINYKYFTQYSYPVHIIIDRPLDYSDRTVQESIEELLQKFEQHPHIAGSSLRISWLKYYQLFSKSSVGRFMLNGYNISDKLQFIDGLRNVFLRFPQAREFREDIVFNDDYTEIMASRFLIPTTDADNIDVETRTMKDLYNIVDQSNLPVRIHSFLFHLFEQAYIIQGITIQTGLVTTALICMVFFLFIPKCTYVLCISSVVLCTICETVGYMSWWNVKLDIASLTTLILSVGFSINYPTHLSFSFLMANSSNADERIRTAIYNVGLPIFQGSVTTVLGVVVLAFEKYYGTKCFFSVIFIIAMLTVFHALLVIPVLLSILVRYDEPLPLMKRRIKNEEQSLALTELVSANSAKCDISNNKGLLQNENNDTRITG